MIRPMQSNIRPPMKGLKMTVRHLGLAAAALLAFTPVAGAQITGTEAPEAAAPAHGAAAAPAPKMQVKGNPVVGKVNGTEIHYQDVESAMATLPQQYRDLPEETLFPSVLQQLIDGKLMAAAARKSGLDKDPAFLKHLEEVKERALQEAYITKNIDAEVTDANVKTAYDQLVAKMPPQEEVHARHILVKTEADAKAIKKQLDGGADFAKLADEKSSDGAAKNGGDLGFFTKDQMVAEFSTAAFALKKGEISGPVKSSFGWHIIKLEERRTVSAPPLDQVAEEIRSKLASAAFQKTVEGLRKDAKVETFNPDGSALTPPKPAAP